MKFSYRNKQRILCFRNYIERHSLPPCLVHPCPIRKILFSKAVGKFYISQLKFTAPKAGCGGFEIYTRITRLANRGINLMEIDR